MFEYANEALANEICTHLHTFPEQKSEYWIKPGSCFILLTFPKGFTEGIFDYQKSLSLHKSENTINSQKK